MHIQGKQTELSGSCTLLTELQINPVQLEKTQSLIKPTEKIGDKSNVLLTLHLR